MTPATQVDITFVRPDACNHADVDAIISTVRDNLISRGTPEEDIVSIEATCNNNVVDVQVTLMSTITAALLVRNVTLGRVVLGDGTVGELTMVTTTTAIAPTAEQPSLTNEVASPSSGTTNWQISAIVGLLMVLVVAVVLAKRRSRQKRRFPKQGNLADHDAPDAPATPMRGTLPTCIPATGSDVTPEQKKLASRNLGAARTLCLQTEGEDPEYELGEDGRAPPAMPPKSVYEYDARVIQAQFPAATYGEPVPYDYDIARHVVSPAYDEAGGGVVVQQAGGGGGGGHKPQLDHRTSILIYEPLYAEIQDVLPGYEVPRSGPVYEPRGCAVPGPLYGPRNYEVPTPVHVYGNEIPGPVDGTQGYEVPAP